MDKLPGKCYLICAERAHKHARHYIGYSDWFDHRIDLHRKGQGAKLIANGFNAHGIGWEVVKTWEEGVSFEYGQGYEFEKKLKARKDAAALCPRCAAKRKAYKNANQKSIRNERRNQAQQSR